MQNNSTPNDQDFGKMILGEMDVPAGYEDRGHDLDAPPADLPPVPTASEMAAAGAEYVEDDAGFTLPSITYHNRTELFHLMTSIVGDEGRPLGHLYRQGRFLVRVDDDGTEVLGSDAFAGEVDKRITLVKRNAKDEPVMELFPADVAKRIVTNAGLCEHVRPLAGITGIPLFREDGSLFRDEGYDDATRYVLRPDESVDFDVKDKPTAMDVAEAVRIVLTPIAGFPFVSEADRNAWIGMALTPMLRFIAPGPYKLGLIEAHQAGSGKSFLAAMLSELHGGDVIPNLPGEDAELRKLVTSVLQAPSGVVVFDNVEGKVSSPTLAALLTTPKWSDRLLGKSAKITLANDRLWVATGNNIVIDGDLARRVLRCVIDPKRPHPERRLFDFNPVTWVKTNRGAYLSALGTLVRAWVSAGMPLADATGSDSYVHWQRVVGGVLTFAGIDGTFDAVADRVELGASDSEWFVFLTAVRECFGDDHWRMAEVVDAIAADKIDAELLPGQLAAKWSGWATPGFTKSLGRWAMNREGKYVNSLVMEGAGMDGHRKVKRWRVRAV
jgi:hypothetical protein